MTRADATPKTLPHRTDSAPRSATLPRTGAFVLVLIVLALDLASKYWAATTLASGVHPIVLRQSDGATVQAALQTKGWSAAEIGNALQQGTIGRYVPVHGIEAKQQLTAADLSLDLVTLEGTGLLAPRRWRPMPQDLGQQLDEQLAAAWRVDVAAVPALLQQSWRMTGRLERADTPIAADELIAVREHSIHVMDGFSLVYAENFGAAWSFLATSPPIVRFLLFVTISTVASLIMGWVLWQRKMASALSTWALAAIMGGAVGNLIDRIHYRAVVDFIFNFVVFDETSFWGKTFGPGLHGWPVWNIADAGITVGVILIALDSLRQPKVPQEAASSEVANAQPTQPA
jgi:signal peptidase II